MNTSFYLTEKRIPELKTFIKQLPSARFKHNPLKQGNQFLISLEMDMDDSNKLSLLQNKWYDEDNKPEPTKGFWKRILGFN